MLIRLPCGCCCQLAKDGFDYPDQDITHPPFFHNWIPEQGTNSHEWKIKSGTVQIVTGDGNDYTNEPFTSSFTYLQYGSAEIAIDGNVIEKWGVISLPAGGKIQLRLGLASTGAFAPCAKFAVEIECGESGDCGVMRLFTFDRDDFTGQTQIGDKHDVPINFSADTDYGLKLCVDVQKKQIRASVTRGDQEQWHHADNIVVICQNEDFPVDGCPDLVDGMQVAVDARKAGTYKFDDFFLGQIKLRTGHYGYGYGYYDCYTYYGNHCPECLRRDLGVCEETQGVSGGVEVSDCQWHTVSGRHCFKGSSSGVDSNGNPDSTAMVEMSIHVPPGGTTVTTDVSIGAVTLTFAIDGSGNWTLDLSTGESDSGTSLAMLDKDATLRICCLPDLIIGSFFINDVTIARIILDHVATTDCSGDCCGHAEAINDLRVVHHLLEKTSCFRCLPEPEPVLCGDCTLPNTKTVSWVGGPNPPSIPPGVEYTCSEINCEASWGMVPDPSEAGACTYITGLPGEPWPDSDCDGTVTFFSGWSFDIARWIFAEYDWMCSNFVHVGGAVGVEWNPSADPLPDIPVTPYLALIQQCEFNLPYILAQLALNHTPIVLQRTYLVPVLLDFRSGITIGFDLYGVSVIAGGTTTQAFLSIQLTHSTNRQGYILEPPGPTEGCDVYHVDLHSANYTGTPETFCDFAGATVEVIGP